MHIENGLIKKINPIFVTIIKDPMEPLKNCEHVKVLEDNISVKEIVKIINRDSHIDLHNFIAMKDDQSIDQDSIVCAGEKLFFFVDVKDNQFFRIAGAVALTIIAAYAQQYEIIGPIWAAAIVVGGNYALSQAFPLNLPSNNLSNNYGSGAGLSGSTNYGFSVPQNAWQEGTPLPSLVGQRLVTPPRIAMHRYLPIDENEMQHLRMLFAICDEPIEDIETEDVFIDGKNIYDYPGAVHDFTNGDDDEDRIIPWFSDTTTEQQIGTTLLEVGETYSSSSEYNIVDDSGSTYYPSPYHTINQDVTSFRFVVNFGYDPQGPEGNNKKPLDDTYILKLQYRASGDSAWEEKEWTVRFSNLKYQGAYTVGNYYHFYSGSFTVQDFLSDNYELRFAIEYDDTPYQKYDGGPNPDDRRPEDPDIYINGIRGYSNIGSVPTISTNGTEITRVGVGLFFPNGIYYVADNGNFQNFTLNILVSLRPYGETDWQYGKVEVVTDATNQPIRRFVLFDNLPADQWEVQVAVSGTPPTSNRYMYTCQVEYVQEGISFSFSYPGTSLLAVDLPATETFQNIPVVSVNTKRQDYDSVSASTNPAWAAYYKLINDYSIDSDNVDFQSFSDWADFCDEKSFTCGFYLDSKLTMKDVLDQLGAAGGAKITRRYGTEWYALVDEMQSPVQLFCSHNMVEDTFETGFLDGSELANTVLCWYFDENLDYVRTPVEVYDSTLVASEGRKTTEIVLYAVTNRDQAKSIAIKELNKNRLMRRPASWIAERDAINCKVGDVVYVQNNLPLWGITPGGVVSATSGTITCEFAKDFDDADWDGRDLRLIVRHMVPDSGGVVDSIERHTITNPYPNTDVSTYTLSGSTFDRIPDQYSIVAIAWVTDDADSSSDDELLSAKMFQVTRIERMGTDNTQHKLTGIEYYREAYNYDYVITTAPTAESGLSVGNVSSSSAWRFQGRTHEDVITLTWTGDSLHYFVFYRYQLEDSSGSAYGPWTFYTRTDANSIEINNLPIGRTYQFSISSTNSPDSTKTTTVDFEPYDHADILYAPTGLQCVTTGNQTWDAKDLLLEWSDSALIFDVRRYEIKIWNYSESAILNTYYSEKANQFNYSLDLNAQDHSGAADPYVKVQITVVDNNGNEESTPITMFSNAAPSMPSGFSSEQRMNGVVWTWNASTAEDHSHYRYRTQVESEGYGNWINTDTSFVAVFLDDTQADAYGNSATVYLQVQDVDVFGRVSSSATDSDVTGGLWIPPTALDDFAQISAAFPEIPVLRNITFTDNSPSAGYVAWSSGTVYYNGSSYSVAASNTNSDYICWTPETANFSGETTPPAGDFVIAVNNSGEADVCWNNAFANQVIGSAWIRDLAVTNAKISSLDAAKITTGYLDADRIQAGSIVLESLGTDATNRMFDSDDRNTSDLTDDAGLGSTADWSAINDVPEFGTAAYVLDPSNLIADPTFDRTTGAMDFTWWDVGSASWGSTYGYNSTNGFRINATGGLMTPQVDDETFKIPVNAGEKIFFQALMLKDASFDSTNAWFNIYEYDETGAYLSTKADSFISDLVTSTWTLIQGSYTASSGAFSFEMSIRTAAGTGGYLYVDNVYMGRHELGATNTTNTSQLTDGANLGGTAAWSGVTGTGKPADNATLGATWGTDISNEPTALGDINSTEGTKLTGIESGATVGADFTSNLSNIPSHLQTTAPNNSLSITSTFLGFHATGSDWPIYIQNDSGVGKFYCGDGSDIYIEFDGTDFNLSPSEINVLAGRDINLIGSDSDPGKINFVGTSYTTVIGSNASGQQFFIDPDTDDAIRLFIGGASYTGNLFENVYIYSTNQSSLRSYYDSTNYVYAGTQFTYGTGAYTYSRASHRIGATSSSIGSYMDYLGAVRFGPLTGASKLWDLASSSLAFDNAYADDWNNVADIPFLDTVDDLTIINNMKPSKVIDEKTGIEIINDSTLPNWYVSKHKKDLKEQCDIHHESIQIKSKIKKLSDSYVDTMGVNVLNDIAQLQNELETSLNDWNNPIPQWHWLQPGDIIRHYKKGSPEVDPSGKPYISNRIQSGLFYGAHRAHDAWAQEIVEAIDIIASRLTKIEGEKNAGSN